MEPKGSHETVAEKKTRQISTATAANQLPWFIPRTCLVRPFAKVVTARRPDLMVLDETNSLDEPLWQQELVRLYPGVKSEVRLATPSLSKSPTVTS
ncbi:MAG: hypothetical protein ACFB4I_15185 [Cyanophyceae cyanobacterium]